MQVIFILYTVQAMSEKRFTAVLGEVRLHRWSCIVVRHGGHVHRDVFCTWFAASFSSSILFLSFFGVSFYPISWVSRDLIVRTSIALGPSEGASLLCTHSSKYAFFKVSSIGIHYERFVPLCGLSQVLVWHHCRLVFSSCSATQSRPLPFFPPGCTFLVATSTVRRQLLQLLRCSIMHCGPSFSLCLATFQLVTCFVIPVFSA